jgi:hypothetical protein
VTHFVGETKSSNAMDDLYDLVLGMFGVAIAAVMLVAGELYLVSGRIRRKCARSRLP